MSLPDIGPLSIAGAKATSYSHTDEDHRKIKDFLGGKRLKVGIDFGSTTSSVCWDFAIEYTPLAECCPPQFFSDRLPTVANVVRTKGIDGIQFDTIVFGNQPIQDVSTSTEVITRIEFMKLSFASIEIGPELRLCGDGEEIGWFFMIGGHHDEAIKRLHLGDDWNNLDINEGYLNITKTSLRTADPLLGTYETVDISQIDCFVTLYLRYLLRLVKSQVAAKMNIDLKTLDLLFHQYTDVAVSVPVIWNVDAKARLRTVLHLAEFPATTSWVSEGKSAALYHLVANKHHLEAFCHSINVVVDIGGGTVDISSVLANRNGTTGIFNVAEIHPQYGMMRGSQSLNEIFKKHMIKTLKPVATVVRTAFSDDDDDDENEEPLSLSERQVFDAVGRGFEMIKWKFDNCQNDEYEHMFFPDLLPDVFDEMTYNGFRILGGRIYVKHSFLRQLFNEWLGPIITKVGRIILELKSAPSLPKSIEIALTGWGAFPPYVKRVFQGSFESQGIQVKMAELKEQPAVVMGNHYALLSQRILDRRTANFSLALRVSTEENFLDHEFIQRGAAIHAVNSAQLTFSGILPELRSPFPWKIVFDIKRDHSSTTYLEKPAPVELEEEYVRTWAIANPNESGLRFTVTLSLTLEAELSITVLDKTQIILVRDLYDQIMY